MNWLRRLIWRKRKKALEAELAMLRTKRTDARENIEQALHSLKPDSDSTTFVPSFGIWCERIEHQDLNLHDALEMYINDYDLAMKERDEEPERVLIARTKLNILESSGISFEGDDAHMLDSYKMMLRTTIMGV